MMRKDLQNIDHQLLADIKQMIDESRIAASQFVNARLTLLYWSVGKRINEGILGSERAEYGQQIIASLSRQLEIEYGKGYSEKNLRRAMQFQQVFPDFEIVASLMRQLSWTHFIALIPISNELSAPSGIPPSIPNHLPAAPGSFFDPAPLP